MNIDFSPIRNGTVKLGEYSRQFQVEDLRDTTNASIDYLLNIIRDASDAEINFIPYDPEADDPFALPEEQFIGWSLGHLVSHVTASSEESAAIASILARGVPYSREPRLRYETAWRDMNTRAKAIQRLEESRRMRLGYLSAFPDTPHLENLREISERARERYGFLNAISQYLSGLLHETGHYTQFQETARQAREASREGNNLAQTGD